MSIRILLLFLMISSFGYNQKKTIDSLWIKVKNAESDTQKVNNLNKIFFIYHTQNIDSSQRIAEQALELSTKISYALGKATSYNNLGKIYYYKADNTKALANYLAAARILESMHGSVTKSYAYKRQLSTSFNNIGMIYQRQQMYKKAEQYLHRSIAIDKEIGDIMGMAHCYNNLGTIKEETGKYDEAVENYEIALQLKLQINDIEGIPSTLINLGIIRMNQKKFIESKDYFDKALEMSRKLNNKQDEALALINLGDMFYLQERYTESITYYKKGIDISKSQKYDQFLIYAYQSLSLAYRKINDFEKAYEHYHTYVTIKDSLYNSENYKVLNDMEAKYENEVKEKEIKLLKAEKSVKDLEINNKKTLIYVFIGGCLLLGFLVILLYRAFVSKRNTNSELDTKNQKLELAYTIIEQKQKEIVDSINYAKRIQYSLLAHHDFLKANLNEHFILYKPKDIVSGDFYWATKQQNKFFLAVCDSTGHGVPGSFMSLLNIGFLSEAINEKGLYKPNEALNYVRERLIGTISQEGQMDGFDGVLLCIDKDSDTITYSAANNTPIIIENNTLRILPKNKMPVGIGITEKEFELFTIEAEKGSTLYLFTDGYADQFGGEKGKKFMYKRLESLLLENHHLPLNQQAEKLEEQFHKWKGDLEQVDDVCVLGIRI